MSRVSQLPILISVPHGGTEVPKEVRTYCRLNTEAILRDGDTWARELYCVADKVAYYVDTNVARAIVDMNRDPNDLTADDPDGVVKLVTVEMEQVWNAPSGLPVSIRKHLIDAYHKPYHQKLDQAASSKRIVLGVDCHTMLAVGPVCGESRPLICISNRGNGSGDAEGESVTAPKELILAFKEALVLEFSRNFMLAEKETLVSINQPFRGGYITQYHGNKNQIPWIQIEINRKLYLPADTCQKRPDQNSFKRLEDLRQRILRALGQII